jgi:hypothetical protein
MSKAFRYVNRRGDVYFLQSKAGANGKLKYSFSRMISGTPVTEMPDGYETRELPDTAQVVIRGRKPSVILPAELELLTSVIRYQADDLLFIVDVEERSLVVYVSDMDADAGIAMMRLMRPVDPAKAAKTNAYMPSRARYSKMMRFTLIDAEQRHFNLDRWCFLGSIDDWFFLDGDAPLQALAEKYVQHLGQESFFELM